MHAELTTGRLLADGISQLTGRAESAQLDAEILLAHTLGVSRARLKSHPEETQTAANAERYRTLVARRAEGEPVAYIVGSKGFWTLTLRVTPAVLVPRPETELIVERALELLPADTSTGLKRGAGHAGNTVQAEALAAPAARMRDSHVAIGATVGSADRADTIRIADLGTGSGAIALALASERPTWHVTATDVSPEALDVARGNASSLGLNNVRFLQGRWLTPLAGTRFHLIASNPPYVANNDLAMSSPALRFEPRIALTPGADDMADLREIIQSAPHHLERGGWLLLEHGSDQAAAVTRELVARGFTHVRSHRDLAGHDRMTEAQWAN
jgi:release factor glutamine methyltransferase